MHLEQKCNRQQATGLCSVSSLSFSFSFSFLLSLCVGNKRTPVEQTKYARGAGNVNCSQFGSAFLGFFAASHCGRLMECFWHSNKMIIDHLIRNFRTMAPQTKTKTNTNKATLEMFLCALVVCPDKGNFNELHTLHCTLMQNKYNCKLPVSWEQ